MADSMGIIRILSLVGEFILTFFFLFFEKFPGFKVCQILVSVLLSL